MFGQLTEKFRDLFAGLSSKKGLTDANVAEAVQKIRLALLEADVNYGVAGAFVERVKEKALGTFVLKAVSPGDQFVKVVKDELVALLGSQEAVVEFGPKPTVILLCGLQGAGKTTQCAKLAAFFQKKGYNERVLVAACDLQRPAAIEQLKRVAAQAGVEVFSLPGETDPVVVAESALKKARAEGWDVLILDTAGRLHVDEALMHELQEIKRVSSPQEIFFVASAATGQDAVKTALEFDKKVGITGTILTMLDGTARAGAALSIFEVTKKPLKFEGVGEKIGDLRLFNPESMADRILGMGDIIHLVQKAQEVSDAAETKAVEEKVRKASFTYDDYLSQMGMMRKMGPLQGLLQMLPGSSQMPDLSGAVEEFGRTEAIILSMTPKERQERVELIPARRWRIAKGSGTKVDDVNRLVKGFKRMKEMMKQMQGNKKLKGEMAKWL